MVYINKVKNKANAPGILGADGKGVSESIVCSGQRGGKGERGES